MITCFKNASEKSGTKIDWDHWVNVWLKTAGTNELTPEFKVKDGKVTEFNVIQGCTQYGDTICRPNRLIIGVYDAHFNEKLYEHIVIQDQAKTQLTELI